MSHVRFSEAKSKNSHALLANAFRHKEVFLIVDGVSTGRHIAPMLRGYGYSVIHVQSKLAQGLGVKPNEEFDYIACYQETDDLNFLLQELSQYTIRAVIPGADGGVDLADRLNEALKLPTRNDISTSIARRNKFLMQKTIGDQGLRCTNQIRTDSMDELLNWVENNQLPIVIKPENSTGTDGVHFCYTLEDVKNAFSRILSSNNVFKQKNVAVVAQEMLIGDEYMVNTVSFGDITYFTDIIFVKKKIMNNVPLYDYSMILRPDDERFKPIADYVTKVLSTLGLKYGAAHTEIIFTVKGPVLVEVNPRLTGAFDMSATQDAIGTNHVSVLVQSYIKKDYLKKISQNPDEHQKFTLTSFFIAEQEGPVLSEPDLKLFMEMKECHSVKFGHHLGSVLPKTTSLMNSPGMVNFIGTDKSALLKTHSLFREKEKEFFRKILKAPKEQECKQVTSHHKPMQSNNWLKHTAFATFTMLGIGLLFTVRTTSSASKAVPNNFPSKTFR